MNENMQELIHEIRLTIRQEFAGFKESMSLKTEKEMLNVYEAADLTGLQVSTVYSKTSKRQIPFYKNGKFLYFKRSELLTWMEKGKKEVWG